MYNISIILFIIIINFIINFIHVLTAILFDLRTPTTALCISVSLKMASVGRNT